MDPTDIDGIKSLFALLKSGGDFVLMTAAFYLWRQNERLTKIEAAIALITAKKEPTS